MKWSYVSRAKLERVQAELIDVQWENRKLRKALDEARQEITKYSNLLNEIRQGNIKIRKYET